MAFKTLKEGSKGDMVKALQYIIGVDPDGKFGSKTKAAVKEFQTTHNLEADGKAGKDTFAAIIKDAPTLQIGSTGPYVYAVEVLLTTLNKDGVYTQDEFDHVKTYQAAHNLTIDGLVGKKTYESLFGLLTNTVVITDDGTNSKKPVDYKQCDSKWRKIPYTITGSSSQTIGSSGCGPTAIADIVATWWDKNFTPVESCKLAKDNGYRTKDSGTSGGFCKFIANRYKASKFVQTGSFATMQGCLASGGYVIVCFRKSKWTNQGHYCCLWKDDGTYIYVNDPASSSSSRAKGTYSEVKKAAKQYWCFWK